MGYLPCCFILLWWYSHSEISGEGWIPASPPPPPSLPHPLDIAYTSHCDYLTMHGVSRCLQPVLTKLAQSGHPKLAKNAVRCCHQILAEPKPAMERLLTVSLKNTLSPIQLSLFTGVTVIGLPLGLQWQKPPYCAHLIGSGGKAPTWCVCSQTQSHHQRLCC